jgi:succinoglycan biosynthesis protein ExoA
MDHQSNNSRDVLLVVPCLNEEAHIERLVVQMLNSSIADQLKIVVVDGGSTDRTRPIAESLAALYPNVRYLHNPKRLQSAAVNAAVSIHGHTAEFLIRLDAHAEYPGDYCQRLVEEARATQADSVVVSMETVGKSRFQTAVAAAQNSRLGNGGSMHRRTGHGGSWVDHGHHALMRIDAFKAVSGYDETFSHNEDAELDMRLVRAGYRIWLTGRTSMQYYPRSSPVGLFHQYVRYGHGRVRTIQKHKARPKLRQVAPAAVVPASFLALAAPVSVVFAGPLLAWAVLCLGYGVALGIRARRPSIMMAGPAAMVMHFGWSIGFWKALAVSACNKRAVTKTIDPSFPKPSGASYIVSAEIVLKAGEQANDIEPVEIAVASG